jgi:hypothetical protein
MRLIWPILRLLKTKDLKIKESQLDARKLEWLRTSMDPRKVGYVLFAYSSHPLQSAELYRQAQTCDTDRRMNKREQR